MNNIDYCCYYWLIIDWLLLLLLLFSACGFFYLSFFGFTSKTCLHDIIFSFFLSELRSQGIDMSSRGIVEMVSKLSVVCLNASLAVSFYSVFWYTKTCHLKQSRRLKSSPAIPHLTSILKVCTIPDPGDNREYTITWKPWGGICVWSKWPVSSRLCHWKCRLTSVLSIN